MPKRPQPQVPVKKQLKLQLEAQLLTHQVNVLVRTLVTVPRHQAAQQSKRLLQPILMKIRVRNQRRHREQ